MNKRIAIINGLRTPFCKIGGVLRKTGADDLGAFVVKELIAQTCLPVEDIDEIIFGNVAQPFNASNIARVVALKSNLPETLPAYTVQRNSASGIEALASAANRILSGEAEIIVVGASESMSQIPHLLNKKMSDFFLSFHHKKSLAKKLSAFLSLRPSHLRPISGLEKLCADPIYGTSMLEKGESLARKFKIAREMQDEYALLSLQRTNKAIKSGFLKEEIIPIPLPAEFHSYQEEDDASCLNISMKALKELPPIFDKATGSITRGNSHQMADGATAILLIEEKKAEKMNLKPLGYLRDYSYIGLEEKDIGLGPTYAKLSFENFDLIEMNEVSAAQVLANEQAFSSLSFSRSSMKRNKPIGKIDRDKLNVNGGAIALGTPLGSAGNRLVITLLKELKRRKQKLGLVALCIEGGQGVALALETD